MKLNYSLNNTQVICCLCLLILVALLVSTNNNNFMEGYAGNKDNGNLNYTYLDNSSLPLYLDISLQNYILTTVLGNMNDSSFAEYIDASFDGYINQNGIYKAIKFNTTSNYNILYSGNPNANFNPGGPAYINTIPQNVTINKYVPQSKSTSTSQSGNTVLNGILGNNDTNIDGNINVQSQTISETGDYNPGTIGGYVLPGTLNNYNNNTTYNQGYNQGYNQEYNNQFTNNQSSLPFGPNTIQYPYDNNTDNLNWLNSVSRGFNNTFGQNNGNPLNLFGLMGGANDISSPSNIFTTSDGRQGIANTQNTINGIPASQIPAGQQDLYILKSQVVPPVCPACPPVYLDKKELGKECPPCPPCARCPEPAFDCKKVPNYELGPQNTYLPRPVLNDFSTFGT